ncbi:GGDEF domain-containing protein [Dactylosporangium sp. CA-092794]|uniref:GGDEF domain-containing protein n=1 Tax=Dactylosporangium sp. CA-092794 TaxID=3239929 RepID=UPI003D902AD3
MSNTFATCFAQRRPASVRRLLTVAHLAVLTLPAATILAVLTGHTLLAVLGVLALIGLYGTGYATAAYRGRDQVAQARRDPLTGLPNRALADEMLDRATRTGTPVTVALADVDGLHMVNRNLGLAAGDQYLRVVADRLARAVPAGGVLVRHGGDEFSIVAPGTTAQQLADDIGAALAGPAVIAGYHLQPRASTGVAATDPADHRAEAPGDAHHVRACADAAMYTAKRDGGNQIRVYDPVRDPQSGPDGTRPLLRRRDVNPLAGAGVAWLPAPGDDLIPLLLSVADTHTLYQGLRDALNLWTSTAAPPDGAPQPTPHTDATPGGDATGSRSAAARAARYARLMEHLTVILDAAPGDAATGAAPAQPTADVRLVGISARFSPRDVEALVVTAAEAVYGMREDLSSRQLDLAARAYALLQADLDG